MILRPAGGRVAWLLAVFCCLYNGLEAEGQVLTVNAGATPSATTNVLVSHGQNWRWRRGTNAPQADWRTATDAALDGTWVTAPGGFGYGDDAILGEATRVNPGMSNVHTTVYIRHTFTAAPSLDTNASLVLTVDYDDGFVAYLDGVELTRRNVPGTPGAAVLNTATTGGVSHEASCCNSGNPAISTNLGPVAARLLPGDHVFAVIGVNQDLTSSDFHLIADLAAVGTSAGTNGAVVNLGLFALSLTNVVTLTGSNTIPAAVRVAVNGDDATLNSSNGTWSLARSLTPGMNRFYVAALDANANVLTNVDQDIVYEVNARPIGGTINTNSVWNDPSVVVHVTNNLFIATNATLTINPGVVVLVSPNASIIATNGGAVVIEGTDDAPSVFLPVDGSVFGSLMAAGTNASLTLHHAEIVAAQVRSLNGGTVLMEDSVSRELPFGTREILAAVSGGGLTVRRSRLARFTEVDSRDTPVLVEDSLLEGFFIDGLDIKGTNVSLVVRTTTLRFASITNDNADALDFGPGPATVERCLIHDFPDKGVSIGGASGTTVRDSLIYRCGIGISAYASSNVVLVNNTIAECADGILFRDNPQPAIGVATNMISWGNTNNLVITNTSALASSFSDVGGTNLPGTGNINADPLFVNAAAHDFRLSAGSPALGTGAGGVNMGAPLPVGGIPARPLRLAARAQGTNGIHLSWVDDSENDAGAVVQRSTNASQWQAIASLGANITNFTDLTAQFNQPYYYRLRATNSSGVSPFSNPARAILAGPARDAGGTLAADTTWSGSVTVTSSVVVPAPFTLTIGAGTVVRLGNGFSITATGGGRIQVAGTQAQPVSFDRVNTTFTRWGDLAASGGGSSVEIHHASITRGRVRASSGATALVEDSELSQMNTTGIIGGSGGALFTVRRCYVHDYEDIDLGNTRTLAEDSLFERANSDIFELQGSPAGSVLRRCTFRNCLNPNSDAVDMNGCLGVTIDSCLIYNVTDKGISSGSATSATDPTSVGLLVTNTLIHNAQIGIAIKDSGTASLFNTTISDVTEGLSLYGKFTSQGGFLTNAANNLIWGVSNAVQLTNGATAAIRFSDLQGTNWPGLGNIQADPLFVNAAQDDFRVNTNSPTLGAGEGHTDMGAHFPVGAPMASSHPRFETISLSATNPVIEFWADSEKSYTLQKAASLGAPWITITNVPTRSTPTLIQTPIIGATSNEFYRLLTP